MLNEEIRKIIDGDKYIQEILGLNDYLADNPELSGAEYNSSKVIVELLRKHGIETEYPYAGLDTAFRAVINGRTSAGPRICLMAEYDALPGIGHGCGHCASGSITVLAGLLLNELKDHFHGRVDILGTPDEEVMGGKITMAERGVFNDYDYAMMIHMGNKDCANSRFLAMNGIKVEFHGKTAHASAVPWEGRNALNGAQLFMHALDMMRQHVKPDVRIHGIIASGGVAPNVVPDYSCCDLYVRGKDLTYVNEISDWVGQCAKGAAMATKTEEKISQLCPSLKDLAPNKPAESIIGRLYAEYGRTTGDIPEPQGSSDVGDVDYICPAFHPMICMEEGLAGHTVEMAAATKTEGGHRAIADGGRIMASFAMETLLDSELLSCIKEEYKKYRR